MAEEQLLPLCDVLFNIISLASYFCHVVFDLVMAYALLERGYTLWFGTSLFFVGLSFLVGQAVSLRWYLRSVKAKEESSEGPFPPAPWSRSAVVLLHLLQMGVLWRYFKLFVPVDLRFVKYEVRDLCLLRLVHAFTQAAPLLLLQLYLFMTEEGATREFKDLNLVSMSLSLFTVCWALASFSKNVRMHKIHKLVLTWLGVIFQLAWRLGTVSTRALCMVCYAINFGPWILLVIFLHWVSMFLWLISPNNLFAGENLSPIRKTTLSSLVAFVYVFAYINLQEINHKPKMGVFYLVMALENGLLLYLWYRSSPSPNPVLPLAASLLFIGGLFFMLLYYRIFHVRRLKYESGGRLTNDPIKQDKVKEAGCDVEPGVLERRTDSAPKVADQGVQCITDPLPQQNTPQSIIQHKPPIRYSRYYGGIGHHHGGIPGVFNCRFTNPYTAAMTKRKKKKPTTFIPPPSVGDEPQPSLPFWCRPIPPQCSGNLRSKSVGRMDRSHSQGDELNRSDMLESESTTPPQYSPQILLTPHYLRSGEEGVLPYTLPRQSRYFRKSRGRQVRVDHYFQSVNSSDGDVDSVDEEDSGCWHTATPHLRLQLHRVKHETKL